MDDKLDIVDFLACANRYAKNTMIIVIFAIK